MHADYFTKILEDDLKAIVKPQYVDRIPKAIRSADKTVGTLIESGASMDNLEEVLDVLGEDLPHTQKKSGTNSLNRIETRHGSRRQPFVRWRASTIRHWHSLCSASRCVSHATRRIFSIADLIQLHV